MLSPGYLSLQLNKLRKPEEWPTPGAGLAFILPKTGAGRLLFGQDNIAAESGDVLVLNSLLGGRLAVAAGTDMVFWWFSIQLEALYPLFANDEICLVQGLHDRFRTARRYPAQTPSAIECHRLLAAAPPQFTLDHRSHVLRVAAAVLSQELSNVQAHATGFVRVEDHIKATFDKLSFDEILELSVDELAGRFSCSRRHSNRLFHLHFGFSVAALRMEMRLLRAASLLRDPDVKVINVAEQTGFNHLGLFNTCFKRRFGVSPGQWRQHPTDGQHKLGSILSVESGCPLRTNGLCPWNVQHSQAGVPFCDGTATSATRTTRANGNGSVRVDPTHGKPKIR